VEAALDDKRQAGISTRKAGIGSTENRTMLGRKSCTQKKSTPYNQGGKRNENQTHERLC
jgi:hypothetical protein